MFSSIKL